MKKLLLFLLLSMPLTAQVPAVQPPQVPFAGQVGPAGKFPLFNNGSITMSDADYTLQWPDFSASVIQVISSVPLTGVHTLYAPATRFGFEYTIQNATSGGQSIVVKPEGNAAATGITIANGQAVTVIFDGTNYVLAGGGGNGGGGGGIPGEIVFQGVSDAVKDSTCSTDGTSADLTCSDAPFASCPKGKTVSVTDGLQGLGPFAGSGLAPDYSEGNSLITTIVDCTSSSVAVMANASTRATSNTTARWGTDNGPALFALTGASTGNQSFVIPPGNYLVRVQATGYGTPGAPPMPPYGYIRVHSNDSYTISAGAHIYYVGPSGCSSYDQGCRSDYRLTDQAFSLFFLPSTEYGAAGGTHNVHIKLDGVIEGDNANNNGVGIPYLNWSNVVFLVDHTSDWSDITDLTVEGTGVVTNTYGFSVHALGGTRINLVGITHIHVAKGANLNSNHSNQSFNTFINSFGFEAAGRNITMIGNHFDNVGSEKGMAVSLGGESNPGSSCTGFVFAGNSFRNMSAINVGVTMCANGAVISGNSFWNPVNSVANLTSIVITDGSPTYTSPTRDTLIVGNTFYSPPGCYAAVWTQGSLNGRAVFSQNHMTGPCFAGYVFTGYWQGDTQPHAIIKGDTLMGTNTDLSIHVSGNSKINLQGAVLAGTGTITNAVNLTANSWYIDSFGSKHQGMLSANSLQAKNITGRVQCVRADANGNLSGTAGDCISGSIGSPGILAAVGSSAVAPVTVGHDIVGTRTAPTNPGTITFLGFIAPANLNTFQNCVLYTPDPSPTGKVYCGLYAADGAGGRPGTRLCYDTVGTNMSQGWTTITSMNYGTCPALISGTTYFIAWMTDNAVTYTYDQNGPANMMWYTGIVNQFPATLASVSPNTNISSVAAQIGPPIPVSAYYNAVNHIPANYLGTGASGTGASCLLDNGTWGSCGTGGGGGSWTVANNINTSAIPVNVTDHVSVGDPTPLSILNGVSGAVGGTCGNNTLTATAGQWAIACNPANEVIIPNTINVGGVKVNGTPLTGANVWTVSNTYGMSATAGATVFTQTMDTPASDSTYYFTWQLQQVDAGSGGACNAGTLGVVLGFTEALSNAPITAQLSGRAFNAPGGTNGFSAGTTIDATNYYVGFPFEFTAKIGTPVTFTLTQIVPSNCSTGQNFALRAHLKAW